MRCVRVLQLGHSQGCAVLIFSVRQQWSSGFVKAGIVFMNVSRPNVSDVCG